MPKAVASHPEVTTFLNGKKKEQKGVMTTVMTETEMNTFLGKIQTCDYNGGECYKVLTCEESKEKCEIGEKINLAVKISQGEFKS